MGKVQKSLDRDYCADAFDYATQVVSGEIPAGQWVRLACQRQLNDLEMWKRGESQWKWDEKHASDPCAFMEMLPHIKGRGWKSKTITLEPWQCFFITSIFGWTDGEGLRRFRKALIVVPRKNGKSILCAGLALYLLACDGEPGAEIVSAATTRDQAKIAWGAAHAQVKRTPEFESELGIEALANAIVTQDGSSFKPLSRDTDSLEGLNVHGAVIDELHAHKTREVFDVLDEATGARLQPLILIISTEGDNEEGVFAEQVKYAQDVLRGVVDDEGAESYFAVYYSIDKEDDWTLEESWKKANPNYGVSVFPRDMRTRCSAAKANPGSQSSFLTKRLNVRVGASDAYFNMLAWNDLCRIPELQTSDLKGHPCVFAIDMASTSDLTSKVLLFRARETKTIGRRVKPDGSTEEYGIKAGHSYVFTRSYLPEEATQPGKPNYDVYRGWMAKDAIEVTDGNVTDYEYLKRDLIADCNLYRPSAVGIDKSYNAADFSNQMQAAHIPIELQNHNVGEFTNPMKVLNADIMAGRIHHNGDPVLTWAMSNVIAKENAKEDVAPDKARRDNKIDPAVALIAAKSLQLRQVERKSVYAAGAGM